jgi:hypothetical protein
MGDAVADAVCGAVVGNQLVVTASPVEKVGKTRREMDVIRVLERNWDDSEHYLADLDGNGFAVIKLGFSIEQIEHLKANMWEALEERSSGSIKKNDPSTWSNMPPFIGCLIQKFYGIAHHGGDKTPVEGAWWVRLNPHVKHVFQKVHNTEDLCVSFDAVSVSTRKGGNTTGSQKRFGSSLKVHEDFTRSAPGFSAVPGQDHFSVQAGVNILGTKFDSVTKKADAGFVVSPGSHKQWEERQKHKDDTEPPQLKRKRSHFSMVDTLFEDTIANSSLLLQSPGTMVLWNSKTAHSNYGGDYSAINKGGFTRLTYFVNWQPRSLRSGTTLKRKKEGVIAGKTSTHWAAICNLESLEPSGWMGGHHSKYHTVAPFKTTGIPTSIENAL